MILKNSKFMILMCLKRQKIKNRLFRKFRNKFNRRKQVDGEIFSKNSFGGSNLKSLLLLWEPLNI
jgi:hypothetical protein